MLTGIELCGLKSLPFIICIYVCFGCMNIYMYHECSTFRSQKRVPRSGVTNYCDLWMMQSWGLNPVFKEEPLTADLSLQHHLPTPSTHQVSNFLKSHTTFRKNFRKAEEHTSVGALSKKSVTKDSEFKANLYYSKASCLKEKSKQKKRKSSIFKCDSNLKSIYTTGVHAQTQLLCRMGMRRKARPVKTVSQADLEV